MERIEKGVEKFEGQEHYKLSTTVDRETLDAIKEIARKYQVSVSWYLRNLVYQDVKLLRLSNGKAMVTEIGVVQVQSD